MRRRAYSAISYAALIGLTFVLYHSWPAQVEWAVTIAGGALLVAVAAWIVWFFGAIVRDWLVAAVRDGRPTLLFRSWRTPPWSAPRRLKSMGSRRDRADLRLLLARLELIANPQPVDPSDDLAPATYRDRLTGQHWFEQKYEAGFNQWSEFSPIPKPS